MFLHPSHLQASEHPTPALKHSQYRFKQPVFLQVQRRSERLQFRSPRSFAAAFAISTSPLYSLVFLQPRQAQSSPQSLPEEKHSQYNLRQNVFLQLQPTLFLRALLAAVATCEIRSPSESSPPSPPASPVPVPTTASSIFSKEQCCGKTLIVLIILRLWFS